MKSVLTFNEDLAVIHAYLCADGYLCKKSKSNRWWRFGLRNTNKVLLEDYQRRVKRYFGVEPHIFQGRCCFTCKNAWLFLVKNFKSFHSYEWHFPRQMPVKYYSKWLRAFFDCEAWVTKRKAKDRSVSLECVNREGIHSVKTALEKVGIQSTLTKRKTRTTFVLRLCGKEKMVKFNRKVGFLHPQKQAALEAAIATFINYNWIFPKGKVELRKFVEKKMLEKAKIVKPGYIRFCSNRRRNLVQLAKHLKIFFLIDSSVSKALYNGLGAKYFELSITKKSDVQKVIKQELVKN